MTLHVDTHHAHLLCIIFILCIFGAQYMQYHAIIAILVSLHLNLIMFYSVSSGMP